MWAIISLVVVLPFEPATPMKARAERHAVGGRQGAERLQGVVDRRVRPGAAVS